MCSEFVAQRKLHYPRLHHALKLSESTRRSQAQARVRKIDIVESVEGFGTKLDSLTFLGQLESFCHRQVGVEKRGKANGGAFACMTRHLVGEGVRGAGIREKAGVPVLINVHA